MTEETENRTEQDSLAPVQLDRLTIEEEVASMGRGKGRALLSIAVLCGVLALGGGLFMQTLDREQAEHDRSAAVSQLQQDHVQAYLSCVLPGAVASAYESSDRLLSAIEGKLEHKRKAYGATLERCEQKLSGLTTALSAAEVRGDLEPALTNLKTDADTLTQSAAGLREYLQDPSQSYDYVQAVARMDRLAQAAVRYGATDATYRTQLDR